MMERIITKITSARFLTVIFLNVAFLYCIINDCLSTEFTTIYMSVISYYFCTKDRKTEQTVENKEELEEETKEIISEQ